MKKSIKHILFIVLILLFVSGCIGKNQGTDLKCKVDVEVYYANNDSYFDIDFPFFTFTKDKIKFKKTEYIYGNDNDLQLIGENVDLLTGAKLIVDESDPDWKKYLKDNFDIKHHLIGYAYTYEDAVYDEISNIDKNTWSNEIEYFKNNIFPILENSDYTFFHLSYLTENQNFDNKNISIDKIILEDKVIFENNNTIIKPLDIEVNENENRDILRELEIWINPMVLSSRYINNKKSILYSIDLNPGEGVRILSVYSPSNDITTIPTDEEYNQALDYHDEPFKYFGNAYSGNLNYNINIPFYFRNDKEIDVNTFVRTTINEIEVLKNNANIKLIGRIKDSTYLEKIIYMILEKSEYKLLD